VAQVIEPVSNCTVDSHVSIVRPKVSCEFLGKALLNLERYFETLGVGSTGQTELSRERIGATKLIVPQLDLQHRFSTAVKPMNDMIVNCLSRNANLRATRDLLLPKLISGEISVEHAERETIAQGV
jgi:type I restriction enzyme, S subunit